MTQKKLVSMCCRCMVEYVASPPTIKNEEISSNFITNILVGGEIFFHNKYVADVIIVYKLNNIHISHHLLTWHSRTTQKKENEAVYAPRFYFTFRRIRPCRRRISRCVSYFFLIFWWLACSNAVLFNRGERTLGWTAQPQGWTSEMGWTRKKINKEVINFKY